MVPTSRAHGYLGGTLSTRRIHRELHVRPADEKLGARGRAELVGEVEAAATDCRRRRLWAGCGDGGAGGIGCRRALKMPVY